MVRTDTFCQLLYSRISLPVCGTSRDASVTDALLKNASEIDALPNHYEPTSCLCFLNINHDYLMNNASATDALLKHIPATDILLNNYEPRMPVIFINRR